MVETVERTNPSDKVTSWRYAGPSRNRMGGRVTNKRGWAMGSDWLDRYVDAWELHARAGASDGGDALDALLRLYSADVRYEDVPTTIVFVGHDGITQMCEAAHQWSADLRVRVVSRQTDGQHFALETEVTGTNSSTLGDLPATGRTFTLRGVSVGRISDGDLVCEHRDYWDLGSFLMQVGVLPPPG